MYPVLSLSLYVKLFLAVLKVLHIYTVVVQIIIESPTFLKKIGNTILKFYLPKQKRYVARRWDDIQYRIVIADCIMKISYNFR
jgi:hypothetical protein